MHVYFVCLDTDVLIVCVSLETVFLLQGISQSLSAGESSPSGDDSKDHGKQSIRLHVVPVTCKNVSQGIFN